MANRIIESRNSPLVAPNSSVALTSGVATSPPCSKIVISFTASGALTLKTLDGVSTSLGTMPIGTFTFDIQFDTATWTGTAIAAGFYTQ